MGVCKAPVWRQWGRRGVRERETVSVGRLRGEREDVSAGVEDHGAFTSVCTFTRGNLGGCLWGVCAECRWRACWCLGASADLRVPALQLVCQDSPHLKVRWALNASPGRPSPPCFCVPSVAVTGRRQLSTEGPQSRRVTAQ